MVDRPFFSMILFAVDPEPDSSSFSGLPAKVKMVLPIHRLSNGLFAWDVSLQLSRMSGSPPLDASMISVARSRLMLSGLIGHSFAPVGVNSALRGVMRTPIQWSCSRDPMILELLRPLLSRMIWNHRQVRSWNNPRREA